MIDFNYSVEGLAVILLTLDASATMVMVSKWNIVTNLFCTSVGNLLYRERLMKTVKSDSNLVKGGVQVFFS